MYSKQLCMGDSILRGCLQFKRNTVQWLSRISSLVSVMGVYLSFKVSCQYSRVPNAFINVMWVTLKKILFVALSDHAGSTTYSSWKRDSCSMGVDRPNKFVNHILCQRYHLNPFGTSINVFVLALTHCLVYSWSAVFPIDGLRLTIFRVIG